MKKQKLFPILLSLLLGANSCNNDNDLEDCSKSPKMPIEQEDVRVCLFDFVNDEILENSNPNSNLTKAVIEKSYKWQTGDIIRIKFLNGDTFFKE